MLSRLPFAALPAIAALVIPASADAALLISIDQVGTSVVAQITGILSLNGLTNTGIVDEASGQTSGIRSSSTYFGVAGQTSITRYSGFSGPVTLGTSSNFVSGSNAAGLGFFINSQAIVVNGAIVPLVGLPTLYVSGSAFASSVTFANQTISGLALRTGDTVYSSSADTITFRVGQGFPVAASPTPEPATWATMIGGFGLVGAAMRRRRRTATVTA